VDAIASARERGRRAGLPVSDRPARRTNGASRVRQNRVVPTPVAGAKLSVADTIQPDAISHQAGSDGDKTNSSPGRARHKPSSHCAGNAGLPPLNLYARVRFFAQLCTRDRGCSAHPAFPAPSFSFEGQRFKPRAHWAARTRSYVCKIARRRHTFIVITRACG
jgi:hypothetical protein